MFLFQFDPVSSSQGCFKTYGLVGAPHAAFGRVSQTVSAHGKNDIEDTKTIRQIIFVHILDSSGQYTPGRQS